MIPQPPQDKILFIDTETGGLDPTIHSLLSLALVVWSSSKIVDSKEILINDGDIKTTEKALEINQINIEEHKKNALHPLIAIQEIDSFLNKHFDSTEKITLAGHNVNFDINFLRFFLSQHNYNFSQKFSHRFVDTSSILYYLYLSEKIKQKAISSEDAFDFFKIKVEKRHSALGDAIATAMLFTKLLKLIYKKVKLKSEDINQTKLIL